MSVQRVRSGRAAFWALVLLVVVCLGGGGGAYYYHNYSLPKSPPASESSNPDQRPKKVVALGRIEPLHGIVSLGTPVPDRICEIAVKEGDTVKEGMELVVLASQKARSLEVALIKNQLEDARKRLKIIQSSGHAQIAVDKVRQEEADKVGDLELKAQKSKIAFLAAQKANAEIDLKRLAAPGVDTAPQDMEKQRLQLDQVTAELTSAECLEEKMAASQKYNRELAKLQLTAAELEIERSQSAISIDTLQTQLDQAEERLKESRIVAPSDGKVLRILGHKGELISGQILQFANTAQMVVIAEVYETDIKNVRVGQEVTIISHIFTRGDPPLKGRVTWIASNVARSRVMDIDPRATVDNRVVDVKIELEESERVAKLIGHQVRAEIATQPSEDAR
jgi:HlyD family secretion protein